MSSPATSDFGQRYCSLCDEYFLTKESLKLHIQATRRHPYCTTCKRRFLNMNSLRNHFVYSSRHHYCRACDKSFKSGSGLRVHLEQSAFHTGDSDDEEDEDMERGVGWEDEVARNEDEAARLRQSEEDIAIESEEATTVKRRIGLLNLNRRKEVDNLPPVFRRNCPICLASPSSVSATRCGHIFCTPCIEYVVENTGMCPTCRKPGVMSQVRKIDISVY
ncbi:hypothetical protein BDZ94DRAFT_1320909 [Collybia nuda]|uniref:RING-type domain-containing protein n=1 Tax=Collybia nuda TaxID=64659 RepID=A0A9P5Y989_9AGAR|nr:hypothetical protein BDZ94DRAFT_1320909 [Collybia nuda]